MRKNVQRSKICAINIDREAVKRAAALFCENFRAYNYNELKAAKPSIYTPLELKLELLTNTLNDDYIRTIIFTYLHEMTNTYSIEQIPEVIDNYYLSVGFNKLVAEIRSLELYKELENLSGQLNQTKVLKLIDFIVPELGLEILTLLLYMLPRQIFH